MSAGRSQPSRVRPVPQSAGKASPTPARNSDARISSQVERVQLPNRTVAKGTPMPIPPSAARSGRVPNQTPLSAKNIKSLGATKLQSTKLSALQTSNKTITSGKSLSSANMKTSAAKKALETKLLAKQLQAKKSQGKKRKAKSRWARSHWAQKSLGKKTQGKKPSGKKPQGDKPQGGKPGNKPSGSKPPSGKDPQDSPSDREPKPKGTITTDEDGNEHFDGTMDEQLAFNNGGTYEWTDADGNHHVTEVTEDGTYREVTSADGMSASASYTPHERRDTTTDDDGGADGRAGRGRPGSDQRQCVHPRIWLLASWPRLLRSRRWLL